MNHAAHENISARIHTIERTALPRNDDLLRSTVSGNGRISGRIIMQTCRRVPAIALSGKISHIRENRTRYCEILAGDPLGSHATEG